MIEKGVRSMCITTAATISVVSVCMAGISACFAGAAWWISHEKLRLDLYNRRFDIYSHMLEFYHLLLVWSPTDAEKASHSLQDSPELERAQRVFITASREAQYLFDDASGVHRLLEQMHGDTIAIIGFKRDIGPQFSGPELIAENQKFTERLSRVNASVPMLEKGMEKYLDFHALSVLWWW